MSQIEMVCLEDLVSKTHPYRRFREYLPKSLMSEYLRGIEQVKGASGYGIERLFLCLLLQFMEDLSDRCQGQSKFVPVWRSKSVPLGLKNIGY